jgi:hypothetical protein
VTDLSGDRERRELERRVEADARDGDAWEKLALAHLRASERARAWRAIVSALDAKLDRRRALELVRLSEIPVALLPWGTKHALVACDGERAGVVAELPFPSETRPAFAGGLISGIEASWGGPIAVRDARTLEEVAGSPFYLTEGTGGLRTALAGSVLYVGGYGDSLLAMRDVREPSAAWETLSPPENVSGFGKALPVVHGGVLFVVDDSNESRFTLRYHLGEALAPIYSGACQEYEGSGPDRIATLAVNDTWLVTLGERDFFDGVNVHIEINEPGTLVHRGGTELPLLRRKVAGGLLELAAPEPLDALLVGNTLVLAMTDGISACELDVTLLVVFGPEGVEWSRVAFATEPGEAVLRLVDLPSQRIVLAACGTHERGKAPKATRLACLSYKELGLE